MKKISTIISLLLTTAVFAQYTVTVDAYMLDMDTKEPIPYVNIKCIGKDIKTITNASGQFTLTFDEDMVTDTDQFQILTNGYEPVTVDMSKLSRYLAITNKIYLTPKNNLLTSNGIKGTVFTEGNNSIQNASVRIKNTFKEAQTSVNGQFVIPAKIGDTLLVNYIGMHDKEMVVSSLNPLSVELIPNAELLNTVTLKGEKKKEATRYVDTGFGKVDFDSYPIGSVLTSEDIGFHRVYVTDVLRGRIAGLRVTMGNSDASSRFSGAAISSFQGGKGNNSMGGMPILKIRGLDAIVYYDGFPFHGNINDIAVNTIDNIVILKSFATTILYGSKPTILITSKHRFPLADENGKAINTALVTNNLYEESLPLVSNTAQVPTYVTELQQASSYTEALEIYNTQSAKKQFQTVSYYIDVSEYFMKWDAAKGLSILANIEKIAGNNPKALKVAAYKLEALGKYEHAKLVYQRIATLLPNSAQSYRDLALVYKNAGDYQESLDLYVDMLTNSFEDIDFTGLEKLLLGEMQQLLRKHRSEVAYSKIPSNLLTTTFKYDLRVVFEWNAADAEFELQFVNPKNKFYTWEHSVATNKELMLDEVKSGYHTKEFIIDEATDPGEWMINVKSLEKKETFNPTYLKYTIYKNYGTPNEERSVKVIKLYKQQEKVTLDKIVYTK